MTAAAALHLFFHDCILTGCDGSVLISSIPFNKAKRDANINLSLLGDGFDVIVRAKTALELACPPSSLPARMSYLATRNLVTMVGGPYYNVVLGRKDLLFSKASYVEGNLPQPHATFSDHSLSQIVHITISAKLLGLIQLAILVSPIPCEKHNLPKGLGLLASDRAMYSDPRTKFDVDLYYKDQNAFFKAFGKAMEKLSVYGVKLGKMERIDVDVMLST
ncbi:hem peroxidase, partial [Dillenia turbinata]